MKDQLLLLTELQRHDAKIQELEQMKKAFPAKLETMNADVRRVEQMLERERSQLTETESWRKRQEDEAKSDEDRALQAKQRSAAVKNAKEYMASERELQATRKSAQERQEEVGKLVDAVATAKKSIEQHEADFQALKEHVAGEEKTAAEKTAELDAQIAAERKLREVAAARVRPDVLKKYSAIRMRRGLAMAPVKNGTCQGCNMNIPPQVFNQLQRGDTIELCGTCNRIIYWDKLLENPDGTPAEPKEKPEQ
ncbi:MAG TPA: C4-type zinc ribbon domain-containing protein [Polyangia bacterium]|nr:C4-type zinc ribbon domain-containing protein [Polyangia bacterium]